MRSPARSVARSIVIAQCAARRTGRHFAVAQVSRQLTFAGRKAQNLSPSMSPRPVLTADFAVSVGRRSSAASISSRPSTASRSAHWTTIRASSQRGTCSSRTRRPGTTLPMIYRSFRSYRPKLPNPAAQNDAFRSRSMDRYSRSRSRRTARLRHKPSEHDRTTTTLSHAFRWIGSRGCNSLRPCAHAGDDVAPADEGEEQRADRRIEHGERTGQRQGNLYGR
jgi:hypothetical protein